MTHMFRVGQKVRLARGYPYGSAVDGSYEVIRQLPFADGDVRYRIKSAREPHERVVSERELERA